MMMMKPRVVWTVEVACMEIGGDLSVIWRGQFAAAGHHKQGLTTGATCNDT